MNMRRTREEPFGSDHSTLIVCLNETHRNLVQQAFQIPALYLDSWNRPLMGRRFDRIIVFQEPTYTMSDRAQELYKEWFYQYLPTKMTKDNLHNIHLV